jgi:fluoroquinolone transport system ATP-binding protein
MIDVEDLRFTYPGAAAPTLGGLSFSIAKGEVYGLLGPSGAGKSTTQRILMGLLRGYSGSIRVFGEPIERLGRELYERIGVCFELPTVYLRLTALENLRLFAALYSRPTRDPMEVLEMVDLVGAANQRAEQFSKGMKMRLNLARALLTDPDLLFLDEPTTGQDPARARRTREVIAGLRDAGKTIFLTTHNMAEAEEVCDRVAFLAHGQIPVTGTPEALKREYGRQVVDVGLTDGRGISHSTFPMEGLGHNPEFLGLLTGDRLVSIHTMEASLDDVFIAATGLSRDVLAESVE